MKKLRDVQLEMQIVKKLLESVIEIEKLEKIH